MDKKSTQIKKHGMEICIFFFLGFMIFIFAPLEIYFSNIDNFWFSIYDFLPFSLAFFGAGTVGMILLELLLSHFFSKAGKILTVCMTALGFSLYIQGNFVLTDYGQLDGQPIDWAAYKGAGILSVGIWILILAVCIIIVHKCGYRKFVKAAGTIAVCVVLVQLVTLVTVCITKDGFQKKDKYIVTTKNEFQYSQDENFTILLMDAFDSRVFTELLNSSQGEEYQDILQDFTYYQNTMTTYTLTDFSIPQIITGEKYLNQTSYGEYLESAYIQSPFLSELKTGDWSLNLYTPITIPQKEAALTIDNWEKTKISVSSHKRLMGYLYKLVGFRYLPQPLKQTCWFYSDDMDDLKVVQSAGEEKEEDMVSYDWSNKCFYDGIETISADAEKKTYHFYHIKGLHVIRLLDENFVEQKEDVGLEVTAKAMLNLMEKYLQQMKDKGIYDNSTIIFMADHAANEYDSKGTKQCPILLVKGMKEKHDFKISTAPVSFEDLQEAYGRLAAGKTESEVFDVNEGEERVRFVYQAQWTGKALQEDSYSTDFIEYSSNRNAFDSDALKETGKVYGK